MTHVQKKIETRHSSCRGVATSPTGIFAVQGVRRNVPTCSKISAGFMGVTWGQRKRQWRFISNSKNARDSGLDKPGQPACCNSRVNSKRPADSNSARWAFGLQLICTDALSTSLRSIQVTSYTKRLSSLGLHGRRRSTCQTTYIGKSGTLETCQKNANGSPATERCIPKTFRHGTMQHTKTVKMIHFVPPRNETHCFSCFDRSATGHLYRFTICMVILNGIVRGKEPQTAPSSRERF
ncbi:MAG: hypothetical protein DID92_2727743059 [Candidatus Nitrotoga sp. SPKER]|nr:MAG: hypothetical protein DID92_2727743059 [Candidatus Nitrotoga sp. SPKER]